MIKAGYCLIFIALLFTIDWFIYFGITEKYTNIQPSEMIRYTQEINEVWKIIKYIGIVQLILIYLAGFFLIVDSDSHIRKL